MTEGDILDALSRILDPVTGRDLVSSGRIKSIDLGERPRITLEIPPEHAKAYAPLAETLRDAVPGVQALLTAHTPAPKLESAPKRGPHAVRRPDGYQGDAHVRTILAVSSAKGGVGKSTVAVQLAFALARRGLAVGVLDADIHGPSVPMLTGLHGVRADTVEVEGRTLIQPLSAHGISVLSVANLTKTDGPIVWRGPLVHGAITRMLWDAHWGELDILIVDMPPGTGDAQLGLAQDVKPRAALVITTPQDLALADARKGEAMFGMVGIAVLGHVLNMSQFTCPHCGEVTDIFGSTDMEALADIPLSLELREATEAGKPIALPVFDALAERVAQDLLD